MHLDFYRQLIEAEMLSNMYIKWKKILEELCASDHPTEAHTLDLSLVRVYKMYICSTAIMTTKKSVYCRLTFNRVAKPHTRQ